MTTNKLEKLIRFTAILPIFCLALVTLGCLSSCAHGGDGKVKAPSGKTIHFETKGKASYYGPKFHGRLTANGERFNKNALTAAHGNLPFGTQLRVTNLENGKSVTVRVNDRFPGTKNRIIDLSEGSFKQIAPLAQGVIPVKLEPVKK
jgi:peptidoglycan lytic transglycosylase